MIAITVSQHALARLKTCAGLMPAALAMLSVKKDGVAGILAHLAPSKLSDSFSSMLSLEACGFESLAQTTRLEGIIPTLAVGSVFAAVTLAKSIAYSPDTCNYTSSIRAKFVSR